MHYIYGLGSEESVVVTASIPFSKTTLFRLNNLFAHLSTAWFHFHYKTIDQRQDICTHLLFFFHNIMYNKTNNVPSY